MKSTFYRINSTIITFLVSLNVLNVISSSKIVKVLHTEKYHLLKFTVG